MARTLIASTVALKTGLLCFTVRQYFGLLELVRFEPYFSKMLSAVESLCKEPMILLWEQQLSHFLKERMEGCREFDS